MSGRTGLLVKVGGALVSLVLIIGLVIWTLPDGQQSSFLEADGSAVLAQDNCRAMNVKKNSTYSIRPQPNYDNEVFAKTVAGATISGSKCPNGWVRIQGWFKPS